MTTTLDRSLAFVLGFGFAFLPSYGPFVGLLFLFASRLMLRRADLLWASAALLLAIPLAFHDGLPGLLFGTAQVLAAWLIFKTFGGLSGTRFANYSRLVGVGLLVGLATVVLLGLLRVQEIDFAQARTVVQAIVWESSPALYGHTVLALGVLLAVLVRSARMRLASLGLAALGILMSGSREAAIAWLVVAAVLIIAGERRSLRLRAVEAGLMAIMLALTSGLGPMLGWGRMGFLLDLVPSAESATNMVQGSEIARGDWWHEQGVSVQAGEVALAGRDLVSYTVTKIELEGWRRLQQVVPIEANTPYTLSVWIEAPHDGTLPGLHVWGQPLDDAPFTVTSVLDGGRVRSTVEGPGRLVDAGVLDAESNWRRIWTSFTYQGEASPLHLWVGLLPDRRNVAGSSATFAGFQLEQGVSPTPYVPGSATTGLGLGVARLPYWQAAWQGFLERPLLGWGVGAFPSYYRSQWPQQARIADPPSHAHNLALQVLFERGLLGLTGLALFLVALSWTALRERDLGFLAALAALLFVNVFDTTLLYGGVIYPLVAVAGWRAASYRAAGTEQESVFRQLVVRFVLAATDIATAVLSLVLAALLRQGAGSLLGLPVTPSPLELVSTVGYALLLWPAMAWREGLYPGYGLTAPLELKRQVAAAAYAGLILAAGTVLFYRELPIPRAVLMLTILLSMVLGPIGRALAKRLLLLIGLWGRSVVILGGGEAGQRVARSLLRRPLDGLRPVGFFSNEPGEVAGLPLLGTLREADAYARRSSVRHAVVAMAHASPNALANLVSVEGRAFQHVQFIPEIAGLPVYGVKASSLDNLLALEVRNELNIRHNRVLKRLLDLAGVIVGGLLISPLLAVLALAVYLDSPGPVFFGHRRLGRDGKHFTCWKFRTMVTDATERLEAYLAQHPDLRWEWAEQHKLQDDPRVTRVGRFLRRTSLDELPQLWNVLKGEMSLVGPRPIVDEEVEKYGKSYDLFTMVRPGMAGYWQISGRSDTDYAQRVELDSFYVRNWSVWLDITILTEVPRIVVEGKGAY